MSEKKDQPATTMVDDVKGDNPMQQLLEAERKTGLWGAATQNKRLIIHSIAAFFAGMVFGYDSIVNGASISMPSFLLYFGAVSPDGTLFLPSIWTSLWTAMSALLQAVGGLSIGVVSDAIGRKWCCTLACLISVAGVGMQYAATSRGLLLGGKMLNGFAIGCLTATSTTWASEISTVRLRGPIQSAIVLFTVLMQALGLVVIRTYVGDLTEKSFRMVFAIQFIWPVATALVFSQMPESPIWLLLNNKTDQAKQALVRLYGADNNIDIRISILQMEIERERQSREMAETGSYLEALRGSNLRRTLTVVWLFVGVGFNGASFLSQNVYFLIIAGLPAIHSYDVAIGGFGVAIFAIIASWFYMENFGRRSLWLVGVSGNIFAMAVIGGLYYVPNGGSLWAIAILMYVPSPLFLYLFEVANVTLGTSSLRGRRLQ